MRTRLEGMRAWWRWPTAAGSMVGVLLFIWAPLPGAAPDEPKALTTAQMGSITGTVELQAISEPPPPMLSPYARNRYRPPARPESAPGSPETVVVFLRANGGTPAAQRPPVRIIQRNRTIIPHVTAVQVGTRVDFPNEDDVFHNLFSLSRPNAFNLGRYPPSESRSKVFEHPGVVRVFCDIHSEMGAVIVVLDTPYFAQPDSRGLYRIDGIPPGSYTAVARHDVAGSDSSQVVVRDGEVTQLDFSLGG